MDLHSAFIILEIDENASEEEIRLAYRDLASIWHPDRHTQNPRAHKKASEKMKELNVAYDTILSYAKEQEAQRKSTTSSASDHTEDIFVNCPSCKARNRVTDISPDQIITCGRCGFVLYGGSDQYEYDDPNHRVLCGDDTCNGIIGNTGHCVVCGRTLSEARKENERHANDYQDAYRERKGLRKYFSVSKVVSGLIIGFLLLAIYMSSSGVRQDDGPIHSKKELVNVRPTKNLGDILLADIENKLNKETAPYAVDHTPNSTKDKRSDEPTEDIIDYDNLLTKQYFKNHGFKRQTIRSIQKHLNRIGYSVGPPDGIIGNKTLQCIREFSKEFHFKPKDDPSSDLFYLISYHSIIASEHPDWRSIVNSDELLNWMARQPAGRIPGAKRAIKSGDPRKVIRLLSYYKFDKEQPPLLPLPSNGIMRKSFSKGVAPLQVTTKNYNHHHYLKLVNISTDKEICTAFLHGGATVKFVVPLGLCELRYAVGRDWYGEKYLFGPKTIFKKADKVLSLERHGYQISGYTIELYLRPHGNLESKKISMFDF